MKILFASDVSFNYIPALAARKAFFNTAEYFRAADFSVINLENILGDGKKSPPLA